MAHSPPDRPPNRAPDRQAGGFLIAVGALVGAGVGFLYGQATPGFLIGSGAGIALAVAIWLIDRRRT